MGWNTRRMFGKNNPISMRSVLTIFWLSVSLSAFAQLDSIRITLDQNGGLADIFTTVERDYGVQFFYKTEWLPERLFTVAASEQPFDTFLTELLAPTDLNFSHFRDHAVVIAPRDQLARTYSTDFFIAVDKNAAAIELPETRDLPELLIGDSLDQTPSGIATVRGVVFDPGAGETVIGASVRIDALDLLELTGVDGDFTLELPIGSYEMLIQNFGYQAELRRLRVFGDGEVRINLQPEPINLDEFVVGARRSVDNVQGAQTGLERLSARDIKVTPSFLGESDLLQTLLVLPGVNTVGDGANGFHVRGGKTDQNLVQLNGIPIFNTSHVLGFFSVFNADAISNATLYKGNIPAQFGGRISSVLDIETKTGDLKEWHGNGGIGIVSSRMTVEGPLVKDKTSILASFRGAYPNYVLDLVDVPDVRASEAWFVDGQLGLTHRLDDKNTLEATYYQNFDHFVFAGNFGYDWGTQMGSLRWRRLASATLTSTTEAGYGNYTSDFFNFDEFESTRLETGLRYAFAKHNSLWLPNDRHQVNLGGEWVYYDQQPERFLPFNGSNVVSRTARKPQGHELAVFANDEVKISSRLTGSVGLRVSAFLTTGPYTEFEYLNNDPRTDAPVDSTVFSGGAVANTFLGFEPRVSLNYRLSESRSVKFSYNRLYQYVHRISNAASPTPLDSWTVSTRYVRPEIADAFSLGYFQNFADDLWEFSAETFFRRIDNLIDYKNLPRLLVNEQLESQLLIGKGRSYGVELALKKSVGKTTGSLAYTYSRTEIRLSDEDNALNNIRNGEFFPTYYDQPHNVNFLMQHRVNRRNLLAVNFTFSSGRPVTIPVGLYQVGTNRLPHFSERNEFRLPDYHRLDVSYTIDPQAITRKRFKNTLTFGIYNVYGRENPFSLFFRTAEDTVLETFRLSILGAAFPAVTYNVRW